MTNKMTEAELHAVLDSVKGGDVVRATFEVRAYPLDINCPKMIDLEDGTNLRENNGVLEPNLISVENLGQPEMPEPEEGSFALLSNGEIIQRHKCGWYYTDGGGIPYSSDEIKDEIKVLYHPDGSINEGGR